SLVGHSLGAAVAVTYAVTHPARVERLALVGGVVPGFGYRPSWVYRLVALPLIGEALARCGSAALYKAALARCFHRPVREEVDFFVDFGDRKSTRLNSSHEWISYAVFCLKKKKKKTINNITTTQPTERYSN